MMCDAYAGHIAVNSAISLERKERCDIIDTFVDRPLGFANLFRVRSPSLYLANGNTDLEGAGGKAKNLGKRTCKSRL